MMNNPWIEIPYSDYENHMKEIGQSQVLNSLTKYCLDKYSPENFALLGCATGNGLEHINPEITKVVYAIDINQNYLKDDVETNENDIFDLQSELEDKDALIEELQSKIEALEQKAQKKSEQNKKNSPP